VADRETRDPSPALLLGRWQLMRADPALDFTPGVRMEFQPGGRLLYTIAVEGREQVFVLAYRAGEGTIQTDNPAAPHSMNVGFRFGEGDVLILDFSGNRAWFIRTYGH
jgi:hypothetical protein